MGGVSDQMHRAGSRKIGSLGRFVGSNNKPYLAHAAKNFGIGRRPGPGLALGATEFEACGRLLGWWRPDRGLSCHFAWQDRYRSRSHLDLDAGSFKGALMRNLRFGLGGGVSVKPRQVEPLCQQFTASRQKRTVWQDVVTHRAPGLAATRQPGMRWLQGEEPGVLPSSSSTLPSGEMNRPAWW